MLIEVRSVTEHLNIAMRALPPKEGEETFHYFVFGLRRGEKEAQIALPYRPESEQQAGILAQAIADAYVSCGWATTFLSNLESNHLPYANLILPPV